MDFVTRHPDTGLINCVECKASQTARFTRNQTKAFCEIEQGAGTVVGAGKPGFPGGTKVPSNPVDIIRGP